MSKKKPKHKLKSFIQSYLEVRKVMPKSTSVIPHKKGKKKDKNWRDLLSGEE